MINPCSRLDLVNAYGLNGMGLQAVQLFATIPSSMFNSWIYVCVLNACSHSALVDQAKQIFHRIPFENRTDQIYTTMVNSLLLLLLPTPTLIIGLDFPCRSMYLAVRIILTKLSS